MRRFMHRPSSRRVALGCVLALSGAAAPALTDRLVPPPGYYAPVARGGAAAECPPPPPPFTGTLDFPSKYEGSGPSRDTVNEKTNARYKTLIKPITTLEKGAARLVDQYMASGSPQTLGCILGWYGSWADAGALLGPAANHTGKSMRKWALASLSSAWLRLQFSSSQPLAPYAARAAKIENWLGSIAEQVTREWNQDDPREKINNHYYWAAWSVMATSVVVDRRDLFDWATRMYAIFAGQVDAEGYLPNEIRRQTRAAGYQVYAVTPLAMMAAFGKANHVDLASEGNHALQRAAERAVVAYDDPRAYVVKTGKAQVLDGADEQSAKLAWLEAYCWTVTCSGAAAAKLDALRPMNNARLGGDVTAVFAGP